jgi:hypothetical protein
LKSYPLSSLNGLHNFDGIGYASLGYAPLGHPNGVLHPNGVPAAAAPLKNVVININQ